MALRGFWLASSAPDAPFTDAIGQALLKSISRCEAWWANHPRMTDGACELLWSPTVGAKFDDPSYVSVELVPSIDVLGDIAYHSVRANGQPYCEIGWSQIVAEGGTMTGPDGAVSAISHELLESLVDWTCTKTVANTFGGLNPDGYDEPIEICDRGQGSDYCEPGSEGIYTANAVGPRFWKIGETGALDMASDVGRAALTRAFQQLPGGYHEQTDLSGVTTQVMGDRCSAAMRARVFRNGARGGKRRTR